MFLTRQRIINRVCDGKQWRYEVVKDGGPLQLWSIWRCLKSREEDLGVALSILSRSVFSCEVPTVESQLSLQKVAGTVSPVSSVCL